MAQQDPGTTGEGGRRLRWLLITLSTPKASSSLRVHAWRTLRSLGALYLQHSVSLLPDRPETTRAVNRLVDRIRQEGGTGRVLPVEIMDLQEEQAMLDAFRAERSDEYAEVCSRTPDFLHEIDSERAKGRTIYTEVEESEADLDRLRTWFRRIQARDYFNAPGRAEAAAAVEACAQTLAAFEADALAADEDGALSPPTTARRLRAVKERRA